MIGRSCWRHWSGAASSGSRERKRDHDKEVFVLIKAVGRHIVFHGRRQCSSSHANALMRFCLLILTARLRISLEAYFRLRKACYRGVREGRSSLPIMQC